jgi:hypothetical protein
VCYIYYCLGACGSIVGCTVVQAGRSQVQFLMKSLYFFLDLILPAALWPWGQPSLSRNEYQEIFLGVKGSWCLRLTTLPPAVSQFSRKCGSLNVWHSNRPPWLVNKDRFFKNIYYLVLSTQPVYRYTVRYRFTACFRLSAMIMHLGLIWPFPDFGQFLHVAVVYILVHCPCTHLNCNVKMLKC